MQNNKAVQKNKKTMFHWHRQLGLVVSIFVIILSVSGILLNHTEKLNLDSNHVKSEFLLKWYGIKKPTITSFQLNKNWVSNLEDKLYFNETLVAKETSKITGAVITENFIAVSTYDELILLTLNGEKIERLNATTGVPKNIQSIGINLSSDIFLKTKESLFKANRDVTEWTLSKDKNITWARISNLPPKLESTLNQIFRGKGLTEERVLLDLHSGRILGKAGPWIMDIAAILLIILSFTGIWMYAKRTWAMRKRNLLLAAAYHGDAYSAADLRRGEEAVVLTVIGDESLRQRLAAMGVMAGTVIATPDASIFGDPRTYMVRGYQLSMRNTEAAMILLQTEEQTIQELQKSSTDATTAETKD